METLKPEQLQNPFFSVWLPFPASTEFYCNQAVSKINWFCFIFIPVLYKVIGLGKDLKAYLVFQAELLWFNFLLIF